MFGGPKNASAKRARNPTPHPLPPARSNPATHAAVPPRRTKPKALKNHGSATSATTASKNEKTRHSKHMQTIATTLLSLHATYVAMYPTSPACLLSLLRDAGLFHSPAIHAVTLTDLNKLTNDVTTPPDSASHPFTHSLLYTALTSLATTLYPSSETSTNATQNANNALDHVFAKFLLPLHHKYERHRELQVSWARGEREEERQEQSCRATTTTFTPPSPLFAPPSLLVHTVFVGRQIEEDQEPRAPRLRPPSRPPARRDSLFRSPHQPPHLHARPKRSPRDRERPSPSLQALLHDPRRHSRRSVHQNALSARVQVRRAKRTLPAERVQCACPSPSHSPLFNSRFARAERCLSSNSRL